MPASAIVNREPVVAGRLKGDGLDPAREQPVAQGVDAAGQGAERADGLGRTVRRDRGHQLGAADVDAAGVGMRLGVEDRLTGLDGAGAFFRAALAFAHCCEGFGWLESLHEVPDGATAEKGRTVS
jgi:hypothetical protein